MMTTMLTALLHRRSLAQVVSLQAGFQNMSVLSSAVIDMKVPPIPLPHLTARARALLLRGFCSLFA